MPRRAPPRSRRSAPHGGPAADRHTGASGLPARGGWPTLAGGRTDRGRRPSPLPRATRSGPMPGSADTRANPSVDACHPRRRGTAGRRCRAVGQPPFRRSRAGVVAVRPGANGTLRPPLTRRAPARLRLTARPTSSAAWLLRPAATLTGRLSRTASGRIRLRSGAECLLRRRQCRCGVWDPADAGGRNRRERRGAGFLARAPHRAGGTVRCPR